MVPRDIFPKLKANIKLGIREDGDGKEVEVRLFYTICKFLILYFYNLLFYSGRST